MEPGFWHDRWRSGQTGFHQDRVSPMLETHWHDCRVAHDATVFVPLCGKSLDMAWLAARGHRVFGVELSAIAVEAFFDGQQLQPRRRETRHGLHYAAGPYEIVVGDAFALDAGALAGCRGVFDRAALIALPADLRRRYLGELYAALPRGCRGLLVTLEFPQAPKPGPPFAVAEGEVREGLRNGWRVDLLERRDILADEPAFQAAGVDALATAAFRLLHD